MVAWKTKTRFLRELVQQKNMRGFNVKNKNTLKIGSRIKENSLLLLFFPFVLLVKNSRRIYGFELMVHCIKCLYSLQIFYFMFSVIFFHIWSIFLGLILYLIFYFHFRFLFDFVRFKSFNLILILLRLGLVGWSLQFRTK